MGCHGQESDESQVLLVLLPTTGKTCTPYSIVYGVAQCSIDDAGRAYAVQFPLQQ